MPDRTFFDTVREMTNDPKILAAVDAAERDMAMQEHHCGWRDLAVKASDLNRVLYRRFVISTVLCVVAVVALILESNGA